MRGESSDAPGGPSRSGWVLSEERCLRGALLPLRLGRRLRRRVPQVTPRRGVAAVDESLHPPLHLARRIRAAAVEVLVHRYEVGTMGLEPFEEDLADLAPQVQS